MDEKLLIEYIASAEARNFYPRNEAPKSVPFFQVKKSIGSKYAVTPGGHIGHDNEDRAGFVASFIERALADIDQKTDASGYYPFELHDSYSYLAPDSKEMRDKYRGSLTFSKDMSHKHVILMPDLYQMNGYSRLLEARDKTPFKNKSDRILFAGTTTGDRDPTKNSRIKTCLWSIDSIEKNKDFYITNIAQMSSKDIQNAYPGDARLEKIFRNPVPLQDHWKYKYVLNVEGNTCCWSRVPMIMASKSLMINLAHRDGTWYYPLMHHGRDFYQINDIEELDKAVSFFKANPTWCEHVVSNANQFVESFLGQPQALYYTTKLLENMAQNK